MRDLIIQTLVMGCIGSLGANIAIFAYLIARRHWS